MTTNTDIRNLHTYTNDTDTYIDVSAHNIDEASVTISGWTDLTLDDGTEFRVLRIDAKTTEGQAVHFELFT